MSESFIVDQCRIRRFGPILDGRGAQQGGGAVDGHRIGTAHAMSARIAECQRRIDGAFDLQQAIKHRVFRTHVQRVILQPLLAARAAARRRAGIPKRRAFSGERRAATFAVAGTLGARGKPIHPQCHRIHAVFHTAHVPAFPIKPSTSLPYAVPSGISIRGLLAAYSQCAPAARKSGRRHSPWNGPGNAHRRVPENQDASASHGIRDAHRMR